MAELAVFLIYDRHLEDLTQLSPKHTQLQHRVPHGELCAGTAGDDDSHTDTPAPSFRGCTAPTQIWPQTHYLRLSYVLVELIKPYKSPALSHCGRDAHHLCRSRPAGALVSWHGAWRSSEQGCSPHRWQPCQAASQPRPAAWPSPCPPPARQAAVPLPPPPAAARAGGCAAEVWGPPW